jgi:DNA polymerase-3 subunit epsilon
MLKLTKPLVFFDLETTGVDIYNDRIVQIGAIKMMLDGTTEEKEWLINPGIPIPKGASDIHGITDDMVADKPRLGDIAEELAKFFTGVDFGGYNVKNFDLPMLQTECARIGLPLDTEGVHIVDAMAIFKTMEPRTLTAAYKKFCGKDLVDAHDAMADIRASVEVLKGQMKTYAELPDTPEALHEFCFPKDPNAYDAEGKLHFVDGQLVINFGKNRGKTLQHLAMNDPGYLEWILNGQFSEKVKTAVKNILQ